LFAKTRENIAKLNKIIVGRGDVRYNRIKEKTEKSDVS
jgi:hypothetical protein